jgi:hypothetical protein
MSVVIRCMHDENQKVIPDLLLDERSARWLKSFDPDAHGGLGLVEWTRDIRQAIKFADFIEAKDYYIQQSTVRPLRADGQPNRPLTGWTVTLEPCE